MPDHDTILHNGKVITLDGASSIAEAVAFRDGRISGVGESAGLLKDKAPHTKVVDLAGKTVTPGMFDAHPHLDREGLKARGGIRIQGQETVADIVETVRRAAARTPPGEWIVVMPMERQMGPYFDNFVNGPEQLEDGRYPDRHDLDKAAPDHPVYIRAVWGWWCRPPFPSVANSAALKVAGITAETPAPFNCEILKDSKGEPTGVFLERNHCPVLEYTILGCVPRFSHEDRVASVRLGVRLYSEVGTTACYEGHGLTHPLVDAYRQVEAEGGMTLKMHTPLSVPTSSLNDRQVADLLRTWANAFGGPGSDGGLFRCEGVTFDMGQPDVAAIIGRGYPYEQWAGHFYQSVPLERFVELGVMAAKLGIRVNCLACYDLEALIKAYEEIDKQVSIRDKRWVMVHLMDGTEKHLKRLKKLGVIATIIPNVMYWFPERFGLDKLMDLGSPVRQCLDMGVPLALSTDNVPYSMFFVMWEALARWDEAAGRHLGDANLTREEAMRCAMQSGHLLSFDEDKRGSLEVDKMADAIVIDEDPLTCDEEKIKDIRVLRTYLGGREVYRAEP